MANGVLQAVVVWGVAVPAEIVDQLDEFIGRHGIKLHDMSRETLAGSVRYVSPPNRERIRKEIRSLDNDARAEICELADRYGPDERQAAIRAMAVVLSGRVADIKLDLDASAFVVLLCARLHARTAEPVSEEACQAA